MVHDYNGSSYVSHSKLLIFAQGMEYPSTPSSLKMYMILHVTWKWQMMAMLISHSVTTSETIYVHLWIPKIQRRPPPPTALTFYATDATCHGRWNFEVVPARDTVYKCQIFLYSFDRNYPYLVCCSCHVCHISSYANATPRPRDDCAARGKPGIRWSR